MKGSRIKRSAKIVITNHAIERFYSRNFGEEYTESQIAKLMTDIATKGKIEERKQPYNRSIYRITYQGESIVVEYTQGKAIILTYLGTRKLQNWYLKQEVLRDHP